MTSNVLSYCVHLNDYELFVILMKQRQDNLNCLESMRPARAATTQPMLLSYRYFETAYLNISQIKYNDTLEFITIHDLKFAADFVNVQVDKHFYMFGWDEGQTSVVSRLYEYRGRQN